MSTSPYDLNPDEALKKAALEWRPGQPAIAPYQATGAAAGLNLPAVGPQKLGAGSPDVDTSAQQPAAKGTLAGDKAEVQRLKTTGPGVNQVQNPILHGIGKVADVLGGILAPGLTAKIPGTTLHNQQLLGQANKAVTADEANAEKEAQTANLNADVPLRQAETTGKETENAEMPEKQSDTHALAQSEVSEHNAQAAALLHPQAKTDFEAWQKQNPDKPIEEWLKLLTQNKPESGGVKGDLQAKLVAAQNAGDTATAAKLQKQLKDIDPMGEQRIVIQQQGQANAQAARGDAKIEKEFQYTRGKWDKDLQTYQTQNEKLGEANDMVGRGAMGAALGSVKALSGLAAGQGSGVRITQAELNSIAHARGFSGDFDAFLQQFGDGNKLTPEQITSLKGIVTDIQRIAQAKEAVINQGLDDLGNAKDTPSIRKIDSQLRHVLMGAQ
jgi:hypothetical protein